VEVHKGGYMKDTFLALQVSS